MASLPVTFHHIDLPHHAVPSEIFIFHRRQVREWYMPPSCRGHRLARTAGTTPGLHTLNLCEGPL
jgi:hypothetical protein